MKAIVVGVDDSGPAKGALRWAVEEGRLRGDPVVALHAWQVPVLPIAVDVTPLPPPVDPSLVAEIEEAATRLVERVVEEVVGDDSTVEVRPTTAEGPAASVLIEAAADADLLVVGARGRGGFIGLLLGSVTEQCVRHAPCPVLVHRSTTRDAGKT
jgi:nucleotide-binding universal stress UspA family protein